MTLKVVHTFGRNAGAVQSLARAVVRFGRAPENDVVFDPDYDRDASGQHAEARFEGGRWVLVDLKSRNGTFVKGQRVERHVLTSGDEVTFGPQGPRVRIEILADGAEAARRSVPAPAPARRPAQRPLPGTAAIPVFVPPTPDIKHSEPPPAPPPPRAPMASDPARSAPAPHRSPMVSEPRLRPAAPPSMRVSRPHVPAPAAGAPVMAGGKRVGQRTIAEMIASAVAAARSRMPQKQNTRILRDYVDREVDAATAGQKRTTGFLALLLLVALSGLAGLLVWNSRSNDDIDKLRTQLAGLSPDDPRRKDIESRLGSLHPANANFGRNLYDSNRKGIFMLTSGGQGFCTAFAVRPSVLATNAHCVIAAQKRGGTIVALENEGRSQVSFAVNDMRAHPGFRDSDQTALSPDVGIVNISGRAATVLAIASQSELAAVGAGDEIYMIGFPGRLMDTSNPAATFMGAHVGRVTGATGRPSSYSESWLVQHDGATSHGTSGSPIFNSRGKVIAINAGSYQEGDSETIAGRKTEVVKASPYKFGMRIDLLNAILR